jgi:hypothetical protein
MAIINGSTAVHDGRLAPGSRVRMQWRGQVLTGEVLDLYRALDGEWRLRVRHGNGTPWPFDPTPAQVGILLRE